jgi:hypothetical protein
MTRTRNDAQRPVLPSQGFLHRRRPLGTGETLPPKGDLLSQIIALSEEAKRLRAKTPPEPEQAVGEEDEGDLDAEACRDRERRQARERRPCGHRYA